MRAEDTGGILRFETTPPSEPAPDRSVVVLDTTWTPPLGADHPAISLRDVAERVLLARDLNAESAELLDDWAEASGVVDLMAVEGTSFWYYGRVGHAMWLREQVLWLGIVDELVAAVRPARIECAASTDAALVEAARLVAARDGLEFQGDEAIVGPAPAEGAPSDESTMASEPTMADEPATSGQTRTPPSGGRSLAARTGAPVVRRLARGVRSRLRPDARTRRIRLLQDRLVQLAEGTRRPLLAVHTHAVQRVDTPDGPRLINPYLDPIEERLRDSRLDPVTIELWASSDDDEAWARLIAPGSERLLPAEVLRLMGAPADADWIRAETEATADRIGRSTVPLLAFGVDLGPALAARVADQARRLLPSRTISIWRIRRLIRELRPAGLLLADEYHRQDWLAAARAEGVPTVAVQHGLIYRWHNGYIHRSRPDALRLPDRTYVFGAWERRLLTSASVYREDEVRVGGSPRLDLVAPEPVDREAVRSELGIAPGDRMIVISGTWGTTYRRFHYPLSLARLFDRPIPRAHVVVKLHPGEPDDGPYRAVIEGVAAARGFDPPPITVVRTVDLYRLLGAADAHLGVHSTVLTEAVVTGTPNLLADTLAGAGPARLRAGRRGRPGPQRGRHAGGARCASRGRATDDARRAFLDDHFEPGDASGRIAAELLAWLP